MPDEACDVAYEVVSATRMLSSYPVVRQLDELERLLVPYRTSREVRAFLEVLRDELRERRWLTQWLPPTEPGRAAK